MLCEIVHHTKCPREKVIFICEVKNTTLCTPRFIPFICSKISSKLLHSCRAVFRDYFWLLLAGMLYEMSACSERDSLVCSEQIGHILQQTDGFVFYHCHRLI